MIISGNVTKDYSIVTNKDYVKNINNVSLVNFTSDEKIKLELFLRSLNTDLFDSVDSIYSYISANFKNPWRFLIVPYNNKGIQRLNILKMSENNEFSS